MYCIMSSSAFTGDIAAQSIFKTMSLFSHFVFIISVELTIFLLLVYKEYGIVYETVVPHRCKMVFHNTPLNTS